MIETRQLTRRFGSLTAVDQLTLKIPQGEIFGLVGPDGAGKTTTLRMLCGLMDPTAGQALVAGFDVQRNLDAVRDRIGYMAQRFGLYQDLTVAENMVFYSDLFGLPPQERETLMTQLLEMTRMTPFRHRPAGQLSGGMKQKLALMCTLLHHPKVLLLDEPTNGVDPVSRRDFWAILYQLVKGGLTVLVSTAYLDEAERCNRVGLMHRGKLVLCDTPAALKKGIPEAAYTVTGPELRTIRQRLAAEPGVVSVEPSGMRLHLFVDRAQPMAALQAAAPAARFEPLEPSLEDVFIVEVRRSEAGRPA